MRLDNWLPIPRSLGEWSLAIVCVLIVVLGPYIAHHWNQS